MVVIGWIFLICAALLGLAYLGAVIAPYITAEYKSFTHKVTKIVQDKKVDADKRSEERQNRYERKRKKDFELADRKLDAKLNKVEKKIKLQTERLRLAELQKQVLNTRTEEVIEVPAAPAADPIVDEQINSED